MLYEHQIIFHSNLLYLCKWSFFNQINHDLKYKNIIYFYMLYQCSIIIYIWGKTQLFCCYFSIDCVAYGSNCDCEHTRYASVNGRIYASCGRCHECWRYYSANIHIVANLTNRPTLNSGIYPQSQKYISMYNDTQ